MNLSGSLIKFVVLPFLIPPALSLFSGKYNACEEKFVFGGCDKCIIPVPVQKFIDTCSDKLFNCQVQ